MPVDNDAYERLRAEVKELDIDIRSWKKSIYILSVSVTVIIGVFAFFGYEKINNIVDDKKIQEINNKILSINNNLSAKEKESEQTIANFNRLLKLNKEIETKFLSLLPENQRTTWVVPSSGYSIESYENLFEITNLKKEYDRNSSSFIYLILNDNIDYTKIKVINIHILKDNTLFKTLSYIPQSKLNKLQIIFDIPKGNYRIEIGYFSNDKRNNLFYAYTGDITIK